MSPTRVGLLLALAASSPILAQPISAQQADQRSITVTGEAVVNVPPDKIEVCLGVETFDFRILVAKQKNNEILKKTLAAIKEFGVPDKDVQTDHLSVEPRHKDDFSKQGLTGYLVRNGFVATLDDPAKVEGLVTKLLEMGVNCIHGISFKTTELKKTREQARELALKAAREKAEKMAAVLGQRVGRPLSITEGETGPGWWYRSGWWGGGHGGQQAQVAQDAPGGAGETGETIALGKVSVRASVRVVFELKD